MEASHENSFIVTLDDDPLVSRILESAIGLKSHALTSAKDLAGFVTEGEPLAAFVDIHLGLEECGLDVIPDLRTRWPYCPIIVITNDPQDDALVQAFNQGADDFLLKPIKPKEVHARFKTRLSDRQERAAKSTLEIGDLVLNTMHRTVSGPRGKVFIAPVEALLLSELIKAKGTLVPKEALKRQAWGVMRVSDNAFYRKLFELRRAIAEVSDVVRIRSVYGHGLSLELQSKIDEAN